MYNKTPVDLLVADIYNDTYLKTEIDTSLEDIDLSNYYTTTEIDSTYTTPTQLHIDFLQQG